MLRIFLRLMTLWLTIPARLRLTMKAMRKNRQKTALLKLKLTLKKSPVHLLLRKLLRQKSVSILFLHYFQFGKYIFLMCRKMIWQEIENCFRILIFFLRNAKLCRSFIISRSFIYNLNTVVVRDTVFYVLYRPKKMFTKIVYRWSHMWIL